MCRLVFADDGPGPVPGIAAPPARLEWAMPVDVAELGATLEAYADTQQQIQSLRLCHRYGQLSSLSRLPEELLGCVVGYILQAQTDQNRHKWAQAVKCFQGRCTLVEHLRLARFSDDSDWDFLCHPHYANPSNVTETITGLDRYCADCERRGRPIFVEDRDNAVELFPWAFLSTLNGHHGHLQEAVILLTCLCKESTNFSRLNKLLEHLCGLTAIFTYEVFNTALTQALFQHAYDEEDTFRDCDIHCFLIPKRMPRSRLDANRFSLPQTIDASSVVLSESLQQRFARARTIFQLKPHYNISNLQAILDATGKEKAYERRLLKSVVKARSEGKAKMELENVLNTLNEKLDRQTWPQLMIIPASSAVTHTD